MHLPNTISTGRLARIAAAALTVFALTAPFYSAEARPSRGFSQGSRGLKTYAPPPATKTAPTTAQPMQRSATQAPTQAATQTAGRTAPAAASQSRFGTGFMAGLLGAGLIGALFGAGLFGGLGSLTSILGFLLQIALIGGAIYLVMGFFRGRREAAAAGPRDGLSRSNLGEPGPAAQATRPAGGIRIGGGPRATAGPAGAASMQVAPLQITDTDYTSFERLLAVVQTAYGREDLDALRSAATPEMVGYFQEELETNARDGVRNELGEPKLLSGDLSEAWSEASGEYATVAMRYALTDAMVERASGKIVSGSRTEPDEVTEVWTFARRHGGGPSTWRLSAIQQVA